MHIKAVAVTLPNPNFVFTLHSHAYDKYAEWVTEDRERVEQVLSIIDTLYRNPKADVGIPSRWMKALLVEGLDRETALQRVYPCTISAERRRRSDRFLDVDLDSVSIQGLTGTSDMPSGYHHLVISRGGPFHPTKEILEHLARSRKLKNPKAIGEEGSSRPLAEFQPGDGLMDGNSGDRLNLKDLSIRGDRKLVGFVRSMEGKASATGRLKVVMVPNEVKPILSNNRGGELITEPARIWR